MSIFVYPSIFFFSSSSTPEELLLHLWVAAFTLVAILKYLYQPKIHSSRKFLVIALPFLVPGIIK